MNTRENFQDAVSSISAKMAVIEGNYKSLMSQLQMIGEFDKNGEFRFSQTINKDEIAQVVQDFFKMQKRLDGIIENLERNPEIDVGAYMY